MDEGTHSINMVCKFCTLVLVDSVVDIVVGTLYGDLAGACADSRFRLGTQLNVELRVEEVNQGDIIAEMKAILQPNLRVLLCRWRRR